MRELNHRLYGEHSGFLPCCIEFWVNEWFTWDLDRRSEHMDQTRDVAKRTIGYIACPKCLEDENFVKVHACGPKCITFLNEVVGLPIEYAFWGVFDNVLTGQIPTPNGFLPSSEILKVIRQHKRSQVG